MLSNIIAKLKFSLAFVLMVINIEPLNYECEIWYCYCTCANTCMKYCLQINSYEHRSSVKLLL
jgi:hypothetical protein